MLYKYRCSWRPCPLERLEATR